MQTLYLTKKTPLYFIAAIALLLSGCGGGGNNWPSFATTPPPSGTPATTSSPPSSTGEPSASAPRVDAVKACTDLSGTLIDGGQITTSSLVPATPLVNEYCKVNGTMHASLNFEVHLPTTWNGKLVFSGGGGWDGAFFPVPLSSSVNSGYVLIASDGGNSGGNFFDASRFLNNPVRQQDFAYASTHTVLEAVKSILKIRYSEPLLKSYFEGCSNGGREALIAATRFPDDFDGIISRAPAYSFNGLMAGGFLENAKATNSPGGWISPVKAKLVSDEVNKQCDSLDGIADGIVSNIGACHFDPSILKCTGAANDSCLTDGELATARTAYSEVRDPNGTVIYPGWGPGGEDQGWPLWISGAAPGSPSSQYTFVDGLIKFWITSDPSFNTLTFNRQTYAPSISLLSTLLDATPDLRDYFAKGKKLILAHGTNDWAISYKGSVEYFNKVAAVAGSNARDANMAFFLLPGVGHCLGGTGPDTVDYLTAMSDWVEKGKAPVSGSMTATKIDYTTGDAVLKRPLCAYPAFPVYKGSGDPNSADSFECAISR